MDRKIIWILVIVLILIVVVAGAGVGAAYYLAKKAASTPNPSPSSSFCATCQSPSPSGEMTIEEVRANHCLQSPNGGTGNITIADIPHYDSVSSPVDFSGTANVFEATFLARLVSCDGIEISKVVVTADAAEVGVSAPYHASLTYGSSYAGTYGTIEAYDLSAKDGSIQDLIQVPVFLK